jgi:hypothetical protein
MPRPKKDINWDIVQKKMEAGCSAKEIAGGMCNIDTFYDRFKEEFGKGFSDYSDIFYSEGDGNLRFTQYMKALSGNINMLTLLGRERLGQGKEEVKVSPFDDILALKHENMILRAELSEIKERLNADQS